MIDKRSRLLAALLCGACFGCVTAAPIPPPPQTVELAGGRALFRSYAGGVHDICEAEPRWLAEELAAVNGLLGRVLRATGHSIEEPWPANDLATLETATKLLPPLLEVHEQNLRGVRTCPFRSHSAFAEVLESGAEYTARARSLLLHAEELAGYLRAKALRAQWEARVLEERRAHRSFCAAADQSIFYALNDDEEATRYFFCDDARLTSRVGVAPEVSPPPNLTPKAARRWKQAPYVRKAAEFPKGEIRIPPAVPPQPLRTAANGG